MHLKYRHLPDIHAFCKGMTPKTVYPGKYFTLGSIGKRRLEDAA